MHGNHLRAHGNHPWQQLSADATFFLFHSQNGARAMRRHLTSRRGQLYLEMHIHVKAEMQKMKKNPPLDLSGTGYCASFNFRKTARAVTSLVDTALQQS